MTNDESQNKDQLPDVDESRMASLLRSIDADASPPDTAQLAEIRQRTLDVFAQSTNLQTSAEGDLTPSSRSIFVAMRGIAAVAATAAAIWIGITLFTQTSVVGAPFSKVLENLRRAKTLELRVTKDGQSTQVWVRAPGLVRLEDSPERYRIVQGSRLWKIDETANTAAPGVSPWFIDPDHQIDLLGLLEVGVTDSKPLLTAEPTEETKYANRKCFVYRAELPGRAGRLRIEAFADVQTNELVGIIANLVEKPAQIGPPLAELQLVAMNPPVDESKFVVAKSLTDDGRIGKVVDAQGLVVLRPAPAQRWTPIGPAMRLKAGDWLRTDLRGANAVKARLSSDVELILGPGTLLECISPTQARMHSGEAQVNLPTPAATEKQTGGGAKTEKHNAVSFELLAPRTGSQKFVASSKKLVRVDRDDKLVEVAKSPRWLQGIEGTSSNESLGSLIVKLPGGRNEPLTVGYHKVSVEIRDQIVRTTIEESFVNHTPERLEGVFYFPLPADASISGFGMWIGNDLVEADVVEKQRAREIYETILREKKDPGLLEWTTGNLFKARVFPIEAMSEKRIKIVYTQVLPLRSNSYRYSYGLRSELLRTKPLRELSLTVQVISALPLKSVMCPTHSARTAETAHSAQLDFSAHEYTPDRDFEVVCEIEHRNSDVVAIPHRRGDDGYFLLQLMPSGREGNWQREVLPDGKPLQLVLLCDTSASMDGDKRKQQAEFVAAVLASLSEKDRFWLAAADVETVWAASEPMSPTAENITKAREFLDHRGSLGWTNLDKAFEAVLKKAPEGAQIVYVSDGIVTAGESDPNSFVKKLGRLIGTPEKTEPARTFHAVTVGNTYDAAVLKGIAAVGHGSVRSISGDQSPQAVAKELLNEITQPGLRDLKVEFRGLKVAAVYPDSLPQVPAGTQQILVGRYLPTGKDQQGEVVVTGRLGSEQIRYAARIDLKDAEAGNSFIPRLWARAHLDHLLQQGTSAAIRDEIISLSEQFHIITPYTSLLVLETDADRERFGVKRHFEMRDGESFFADGHDNANYELRQQQMKRAGDWRIGMRHQVLQNLATLGRDPQMFQRQRQMSERTWGFADTISASNAGSLYNLGVSSITFGGENSYLGDSWISAGSVLSPSGAVRGPMGGPAGNGRFGGSGGGVSRELYWNTEDAAALHDRRSEWDENGEGAGEIETREKAIRAYDFDGLSIGMPMQATKSASSAAEYGVDFEAFDKSKLETSSLHGFADAEPDNELFGFEANASRNLSQLDLSMGDGDRYFGNRYEIYNRPDYTTWVNTLFPTLASPPRDPSKRSAELEKRVARIDWSEDAIELSKSLLRFESIWKLDGGIELRRTADSFDPRWKRTTSHHSDLALYAPTAWLTRGFDMDAQTFVNYCNEKERGIYSLATELGRTRKSFSGDLKAPPLGLVDYSLSPLHESFTNLRSKVESAGDHQAKLTLLQKGSKPVQQFLIDTERHVLLKHESFDDGKLVSTTTYSDFVEVGGSWWAQSVITSDGKGRTTSQTRIEIKSLEKDKYAERIDAELSGKTNVEFVRLPGPTLKVARQHVADGSADFDDRMAMMLYNCRIQQWDELFKQLDAAEKLAADKPGVRWIRTMVLQTIRRNDDARLRLLEEARKLAAAKRQDEMYLAEFIIGQSHGVASPAELLEFANILKPVYDRQPEDLRAKIRWQEQLLSCNDALGRREDALSLRGKLAEQSPWDIGRQTDYAQHLLQAGQADAAYAWLQKQLDRDIEFDNSSDETLRNAYAELYRNQTRWEDLLKFTTTWIGRKPEYQAAYTQHLSALVFNDKLDTANSLAETWLKESQIKGKLSPDQRARLDVAISFARGNVLGLPYNNQIDDRWIEALAQAARFFAQQKDQFDIVGRIVNDGRFFENAAGDRFRGFVLSLLQSNLESLSPEQINSFISWSLSGRIELARPIGDRKQMGASEIPVNIWKEIADKLHERWSKAEDKDDKNSFSQSLQTVYAARFSDSDLLPFLRERLEAGPKEFKLSYISSLFETLIGRNWTEENEKELFAMLPRLSDSSEPADVLTDEVPALYRLVDAMVAARQARAEEELHDKGRTDELTRTQLLEKKQEFAKAAKRAVAERLGNEAKHASAALSPWLRMEQAYLDVQLNQNYPQVEEFCWQMLGEAPARPKEVDESAAMEMTPEALSATIRSEAFAAMLRKRAFATVMNLAARRNAQPASVSRVLKYIDAGIEQVGYAADTWRATKFQMLVALDRPDDLERELRSWVRVDESTSPWRKSLAMLLAERGKLDEATSIFEALEKGQLLTAADYRTLSDWYLVNNRRDDYEKSRIKAYEQLPEQAMYSMLGGLRNRWQRTDLPLPSQLDENTLFAMRAVFSKSANPENYFYQLRELYAACRDFRLLDMLPDAVLGRSPQQIYSFLQNMQSNVLSELRNEATVDQILGRIKILRERKLTNTDQRALDLMELIVERRASEVVNQPRPHTDACLAAMKRAFERPWSDGEPILMAGFLKNLGKLPQQPLIDEQIRELRALQSATKAPSRDHLVITDHLCNLLFGSYDRHDAAIQEMESEVNAYEQAHDGRWPHGDNDILGSYVHLLEAARRYAAGEAILLKHLNHPENDDQRKWLNDRLLALYNSALESDGEVTLGKGDTLFESLVARGLKELDASSDENVRHTVVMRMVSTFEIAQRKNFASAPAAVKKFAFETMPVVLKKQQNQYRETATAPVNVILTILRAKASLQYIVERMEQYPPRLETTWNNRWQAFGYLLASHRSMAAAANLDLADWEPRVLKLVVAEVQRHIRNGQANNQHIYYIHWEHFWSAKADDFARAAEEVYTRDTSSGRYAMAVANYLWRGLNKFPRAIEILLLAYRDGVLDEAGQTQLAQWLQEQNRHAESIPILEPLVKQHADSMRYRTMLMLAYHRSQRQQQLLELVKSTDAYFHEGGRWTDGNVAEFGKTCSGCGLNEKAVAYLTEAISLHQRANGQIVLGDSTLSDWYQNLANAHSALGHTKEAVDAASGAIVCWSPTQKERRDMLNKLREVLNNAKDLPAYVTQLDEQSKKTGEDSSILRKAIGDVLKERKEFKPAIAQFEIAVQLEPNDKEIHQALIACYDATEDKAGGTRQLLKLIELDGHNLALYQQLADRLKDQPPEAERAITSLIEAGPQEAENHTALAEFRQKQDRWDEAIVEWKKVSELRSLEPTGLVKLAGAQIHQKSWDAARKSVERLQRTEWPSRFGDINNQTRQLQEKLPK